MTKQELAQWAVDKLIEVYPDAVCSLTYEHPHELIMAVRLSAQCTDARVNIVTKDLFKRFPSLESFANASFEEVEPLVRPCGLGNTKARDLIAMAQVLLRDYNGVIPDTMEELLKLPGVGRKTANLVLGDLYKKPAVVTDTHCIRICGLLGLTDGSKVPFSVEKQLRAILPPEESSDFCHRLVLFGREYCIARRPRCTECPLAEHCQHAQALKDSSDKDNEAHK